MDDNQFRQLLERFGLSWEGYRKVRKGVKKRIRRHMSQSGCQTVEAYLLVLGRDSAARHHCERLMTVSISRFFRDLRLWRTLADEILPMIFKENTMSMKVWSAGCACGEEAYSMKILCETMAPGVKHMPDVEIWATDMNPGYLKRAQTGIYSASSLKELPQALRTLYFRPTQKQHRYTVNEPLKKGLLWRVHNLLSDPPDSQFQLIFLRNSLLTYYREDLRLPALEKVVNSLARRGFLIIGAHEEIPPGTNGLVPFGSYAYIFQKKG
jgi:chemotaxis protein methyltransferase CheR